MRISAAVGVIAGMLMILPGQTALPIIKEYTPGILSNKTQPAKGMFLIASRGMRDSNFSRTVVLLINHSDRGTLGIVVNRRSNTRLSQALRDLTIKGLGNKYIYYGGPVALSRAVYLLRANNPPEKIKNILDDVYFGADRLVMKKLVQRDRARKSLRIYFGHASWSAGQLREELLRGDWHLIPANAKQIFSQQPRMLWHRLIKRIQPRGLVVQR